MSESPLPTRERSIILDIETDSLNPTVIWCAVTKDVDTNEVHVFRRPDNDRDSFLSYLGSCGTIIGHNLLGFDLPAIRSLTGYTGTARYVDTLVVSRVLDFDISGGHSLRVWGERLKLPKLDFNDYSALTQEMIEYCEQDVEVNHALYKHFLPYISSPRWAAAFDLEHFIAAELREVHLNGFHFDVDKAKELCYTIGIEVEKFDEELQTAFLPKVSLVREIEPRLTKHGTLNRNDFRWAGEDLSYFNGGPFSLIEYVDFNPGSPRQIVERLNDSGWKPFEKTKGHKTFLRELKNKQRSKKYKKTPEEEEKLAKYSEVGWKVSEANLDTLPITAPPAAKILAKRIKYASRVRTLTEWINNVHEDSRIHGRISGIGAWTHRCSHDKPNTGNIPRVDAEFGREMRRLWNVPDGSYLVGVDAEGIQLRVLAHYIEDESFTYAVTSGRKEDGTDPHSLNKQALGEVCKTRMDAKTFIYAWLLGAGIEQVAYVLQCSQAEARQANDNFIEFYPGLKHLKQRIIPRDAARGYFEAFDGRYIKVRGDDEHSREHFTLAGYLQAGEAVIMKKAMSLWLPKLRKEGVPFKLVNFVHDEWQTEVPDYETALYVGDVQANSIRDAGDILGLKCPMAGSVLSGHGLRAVGLNWYETH